LKNTGRRRAQIHKTRLTTFQRTNMRASRTSIARYSPPKYDLQNECFNKVSSTKVETCGQCKYVIAGAKHTRDEQTVIFCDPDPVLIFENSVQVQPQSKIFLKCKVQVQNI